MGARLVVGGTALALALGVVPATAVPSAGVGRPSAATASPATLPSAPAPTSRRLLAAPGYARSTGYVARVRPGSGDPETRIALPVGRAGRVLWGDWWGRGTQTPAVFRGGTWRLYGGAFGNASVAATIRFGRRGDRPVAGDWDADGRTDLGVVRGRTWRLTNGHGARPRVWRSFAFGPRKGQPVAGDWDGAGPDGVAVYRAGVWSMKQRPGAGAPVRRMRFAFNPAKRSKAATAVTGDWNGDGRTGVALVRRDVWRIGQRVGARPSGVSKRRVARPSGGTPVVWTQAAGRRGTLCPTATGRQGPAVTTSAPPGLDAPDRPDEPESLQAVSRGLVREALLRSARFVLGRRFSVPWTPRPGQTLVDMLAGDKRQEYALRRPAMAAVTVATTLATGLHDEATAGATRDAAQVYVERAVRSIACQHLAVTPGGWGRGWQSGHWAQLTALAAWLVWDELDAHTRADVTAMLLDEADHQLTQPAEYWRDRLGRPQPGREGNTAAEEMAWDVALLELARTMFPGAPAARQYRRHAVQWSVAAYARPRDLTDVRPVNGVPPSVRLTGTNALDDGTVVNHGRVEPDYMGNIQHLWWAADFAQLARTSTPEAVWFNGSHVYGAFSTVPFTPGDPSAATGDRTYAEPGGTIYRRDADEIYFPDGTAWGRARRAPFVSLDAHAAAYGLAPADAWPALEALEAHARGQLALSRSSGDSGRTYSADPAVAATQDTYKGREEYAAQQLASAWLTLHLAAWGDPEIDDGVYPVPGEAHEPQPPAPPHPRSP